VPTIIFGIIVTGLILKRKPDFILALSALYVYIYCKLLPLINSKRNELETSIVNRRSAGVADRGAKGVKNGEFKEGVWEDDEDEDNVENEDIDEDEDYDEERISGRNKDKSPMKEKDEQRISKKAARTYEIAAVTITQWPFPVQENDLQEHDGEPSVAGNGAGGAKNVTQGINRLLSQSSLLQTILGERYIFRILISESPLFQILFPYKDSLLRDSRSVDKLALAEEKLNTLKVQFPGLDGIAEILEFTPSELSEPEIENGYSVNTYRLTLPNLLFIRPIKVLNKILSTAMMSQTNTLAFWIPVSHIPAKAGWTIINKLWKILPIYGKSRIYRICELYATDLFGIQVYAQTIVKTLNPSNKQSKDNYTSKVAAHLHSIAHEFGAATCVDRVQAEFHPCGPLAMCNILNCALIHPMIVTPAVIDLNINVNPRILPQAERLPLENNQLVGDRRGDDGYYANRINLGWKYYEGVRTEREALFNPSDALYSILIAGVPGAGKTTLLLNLLEGYQRLMPQVGILVINCAKQGENRVYPNFRYYKYGENLRIPYFVSQSMEGSDIRTAMQECAKTLTAAYGLLDWTEKFFSMALEQYYDYYLRNKERANNRIDGSNVDSLMDDITVVPDKFEILLDIIKKVVTDPKNQYGPEVQQNITQSVLQRNRLFLSDPDFLSTVGYSGRCPQWMSEWLHGKSVFLDISTASDTTQQILFLFLLSLINILTVNRNQVQEDLQNLIVIDEAHRLIGQKMTFDHISDKNIRQQLLTENVSRIFTEYRSRGIGIIVSDQQPRTLIEEAGNCISTKFLFRLSFDDAIKITGHNESALFLGKVAPYHCISEDKEGKVFLMESRKHGNSLQIEDSA
jgi:hypothetical protein